MLESIENLSTVIENLESEVEDLKSRLGQKRYELNTLKAVRSTLVQETFDEVNISVAMGQATLGVEEEALKEY